MRGWVWGGGVVAMLIAAGAGWSVAAWGDLHVTTAAANGEAATSPANALTNPTTPTTTASDAAAGNAAPTAQVPPCTIDDEPAAGDPATDWATILVDATYGIPADFVPPDLVDASAAGFANGDQVREIVVHDLDALRQAAEAAGTQVSMVSAYRSYDYQAGLYATEVDDKGEEQAQRTTARPGHSEHQLGTAVDLSDAAGSPLDETFAQNPTAQWLADHAHEFGFVISYPDVPPERSCYQFEPWHLRYVGDELAETVRGSGTTLREWLLTH